MLLDISSLQDKVLQKYQQEDVDLNDIPVILQKTYENIAALAYFAQKLESEIKEKVYVPEMPFEKARYILSDKVAGIRISECLDELCQHPALDAIIDVSVDVTITSDDDIKLLVVPILEN